MKPRLFIITYFDKAIVGVCVLILIGAFVGLVRSGGQDGEKVGSELTAAEAQVNRNIQDSHKYAPEPVETLPPPRQIIEREFNHPPIIAEFRRWVLYRRETITYPVIQVLAGGQRRVEVPGVRFDQKRTPPEELKIVDDYDPEMNLSTVEFKAIKWVGRELRWSAFDSEENRHVFRIRVTKELEEIRPYSPEPVRIFASKGHMVIMAGLKQPRIVGEAAVRSKGIRIYRKRADSPDTEYVQIGPALIAPESAEVWGRVIEEYGSGEEGSKTQPDEMDVDDGGPLVLAAEESHYGGRSEAGPATRTAVIAAGEFVPGQACVVVDQGVDSGEDYAYKIIAVGPGEKPQLSEGVVVEVSAPSDIEFYATLVTDEQVSVTVRRRDYDTGGWFYLRMFVKPGQMIGRKKKFRIKNPATGRRKSIEVDFQTGSRLVGCLTRVPRFKSALRVKRTRDEDEIREELIMTRRVVHMGKVVYVDKRGILREKWQSKVPKD